MPPHNWHRREIIAKVVAYIYNKSTEHPKFMQDLCSQIINEKY